MPSETRLSFEEQSVQTLPLGELCVVFFNGYRQCQI